MYHGLRVQFHGLILLGCACTVQIRLCQKAWQVCGWRLDFWLYMGYHGIPSQILFAKAVILPVAVLAPVAEGSGGERVWEAVLPVGQRLYSLQDQGSSLGQHLDAAMTDETTVSVQIFCKHQSIQRCLLVDYSLLDAKILPKTGRQQPLFVLLAPRHLVIAGLCFPVYHSSLLCPFTCPAMWNAAGVGAGALVYLSPVRGRPVVDAQRETLSCCGGGLGPRCSKRTSQSWLFCRAPAGTGGVFPLCLFWFAPVKPLLIILALSCLRPEGKVLQKAL